MSIEKIERLIEKLTKPHTQMHRSGFRVEKSPPSIQREAASTIRALLDELSRLRKALADAAVAAYDEPHYLGPEGMERGADGLLPPGSPYDRGRYDARKAVEKIARALSEREGQE
jgi:hypothetical protein